MWCSPGRAQDVVAVRLPQLADSLDHILAALERRHGKPLAELDRKTKQAVVRILEARGAFSVRHGVETVAGALGVSRFTVYNYLNRENAAEAVRAAAGRLSAHGREPPSGSPGRRLLRRRIFNKVLT